MHWRCRHLTLDVTRPVVMGVLNITPDSFSDGGQNVAASAAVVRARQMIAEGAAIIDVGGESTRPGALPVEASEQARRVLPVIEGIAAALREPGAPSVAISIDTSSTEVMAAACAAGACIVNDVRALRAPGALAWAAAAQVGVCVMHMQGEPRTMQDCPAYTDVVSEVTRFLMQRRAACLDAGIAAEAIAVDPGIGFGKTLEHNLTLLREIGRLAVLPAPLLIGVSRKGFIGKVLGRDLSGRLYGGLGVAALAVLGGARIIRTHDVAATRDAIAMVSAVVQGIE